jgi:hypothetical protein
MCALGSNGRMRPKGSQRRARAPSDGTASSTVAPTGAGRRRTIADPVLQMASNRLEAGAAGRRMKAAASRGDLAGRAQRCRQRLLPFRHEVVVVRC